jgi:homoserine O-acetyltransferase
MAELNENSVGIVKTQTIRIVDTDKPLGLQCGKTLAPIDVAYETYGKLNEAGDNVIFICHALSGNAHAAGLSSPDDKKPGWWDVMIGPGKAIDTNKYFVICSNFLGGCSGTTGPCSINPATGKQYGLDFPMITIADMVKVQKLLLDQLGIKQVLAVIGGSMGGMQVLQWAIDYPDFIKSAIPIATTTHLSAQSIAFDAVGRNAILADPNFGEGQYTDSDGPARGLAIARMIGHITYLSEESMRRKFGRALRLSEKYNYDFNSEFAVETYLDYQGQTFVERFDANCYLYITKAMDYFDLEQGYSSLKETFKSVQGRFLVVSFSSDWLFTPAQSEDIVNALTGNAKDVTYCNIESAYGHDAFLLEAETLGTLVAGFLDSTYRRVKSNSSSAVLIDLPQTWPLPHVDKARRARVDYNVIESLITPGSTVLDIGCGDGELLSRLTNQIKIKGHGIELDQNMVLACVTRGLSVVQHDVEHGLGKYADNTFDYVILSQTLQTLRNPERVYKELLRIGKRVIVSFPNFGYWKCRLQLSLWGRAPVTKQLPFRWNNSPNIHVLSLKDFEEFCKKLGVTVEHRVPLIKEYESAVKFAPNLFAEQAIYVTRRQAQC